VLNIIFVLFLFLLFVLLLLRTYNSERSAIIVRADFAEEKNVCTYINGWVPPGARSFANICTYEDVQLQLRTAVAIIAAHYTCDHS
jgi:hypothetical protein